MGTFALLFLGVVVLVAALSYFVRMNVGKGAEAGVRAKKPGAQGGAEFVRCPLCNTPMARGENMTSKVFRPMTAPDQRMTVQGCPHCYPVPGPGISRSCPVCHKPVPTDGELIARLFNRPGGKKHVMITGCTECCKK